MSNYEAEQSSDTWSPDLNGDVIGGGVLAILGLVHLFLIQLGGLIGIIVLLVVWPLAAGGIAAYLDLTRRPESASDLTLVGSVSGAFGAVAVGVIVFLTGLASVWSGFINDTFGSGLMTTTIGLSLLLLIAWTVFGFTAGYIVRETVS